MKIIFMGTPDFAVPTLEALIKEHDVSLVITQPDKPKGRSGKPAFSPVKEVALENNIEVYQPARAKDSECIERIRKESADLLVVAAFGQILPEEMLNIPKYGSVNVHASLLPKLRGAAPIQWAILNGDKTCGITIMRIVKELDAGNIISQRSITISDDETGGSLFKRMSELGGELLIDTIKMIEDGSALETAQDDSLSTYAPMLTKEMGNIDWTKSASHIERWVRGLYPWPGSYSFLGSRLYKIGRVSIAACDENILKNAEPGTVCCTAKNMYVKTGNGIIEINEIQPSGKKMMDVKNFLLGQRPEGKFERGDLK